MVRTDYLLRLTVMDDAELLRECVKKSRLRRAYPKDQALHETCAELHWFLQETRREHIWSEGQRQAWAAPAEVSHG